MKKQVTSSWSLFIQE